MTRAEPVVVAPSVQPRKSLDYLDVDELGSVQHCLAAISTSVLPTTQGNVESEK